MRILGVDMSTSCGVCVLDSASREVIHAQVVSCPKLTGMPRIHHIAAGVLAIKEKYQTDCAVIEDYAVGKFAGSSIVSIELGGVLRFLLWQDEFPYICVSPTALKKFVHGTGQAKKDQMTLEIFKKFGYSAASNDISDAVGLAHLGNAMLAGLVKATGKIKYTSAQLDTASTALGTCPSFYSLVKKRFAINCTEYCQTLKT